MPIVDRERRGAARRSRRFTGDAVYLKDNLERNLLPGPAGSWRAAEQLHGYEQIRHYRDAEGATLLFSHDGAEFARYRQAPAYYD